MFYSLRTCVFFTFFFYHYRRWLLQEKYRNSWTSGIWQRFLQFGHESSQFIVSVSKTGNLLEPGARFSTLFEPITFLEGKDESILSALVGYVLDPNGTCVFVIINERVKRKEIQSQKDIKNRLRSLAPRSICLESLMSSPIKAAPS